MVFNTNDLRITVITPLSAPLNDVKTAVRSKFHIHWTLECHAWQETMEIFTWVPNRFILTELHEAR